ncbi:protein unc-93 homolog A-like [Watersipora subatra]|uniref:protein unc-93 homolog A-like n=1 Tax=Watersipora subatra TaxID=2589382 RepID=UPI00355AE966
MWKRICPQIKDSNNNNLDRPSDEKLYMLAGIYTGCACLAVIIVGVFLQQLPIERNLKIGRCSKKICKPRIIAATFLHMKDYRQALLIPLTMYSGLEQAFFASDYTQAFITCPLGNWWVGYVVICYGAMNACCSLLFGKLVQYVGRIPFFVLGALINIALVTTFLTFQITQENLYIYFILAGFWGMADAIWQTQINALYGVLFKDSHEAAFSNYRLWESIGFIIAFGYQSRLCLPIKAYILLAFLGLGIMGYSIVEWQERRNKTNKMNVN